MIQNPQRLLAVVAAAGLLALTCVPVFQPDAGRWHITTVALAWVAVLATALSARMRPPADEPVPEPQADSDPGPARPLPPASTNSVELLAFAQELHGTLQSDRLRVLIAQRLPRLVGRPDVWAVARFGTTQHIIVPPAADGGGSVRLLGDEPRQWATFPMKAEGQTFGVVGIAVPEEGLSENARSIAAATASIVGQALLTANAFEVVREASLVDMLTGCATRAEGLRRFEAELRRAERSRTALAVLMLDLDHFKGINDRFGHNTGDAVLSAVGELLVGTLRASDVRCRWGGEEFLLILPESSVERARRAADSLRQRIADSPVRAGGFTVPVTASIGITLSRPGEADVQKLLGRADSALYAAKREGRNRVKFVLGDLRGEPVGMPASRPGPRPAAPPAPRPVENERRDPSRADRRAFPGPGRRRTDPPVLSGRWSVG